MKEEFCACFEEFTPSPIKEKVGKAICQFHNQEIAEDALLRDVERFAKSGDAPRIPSEQILKLCEYAKKVQHECELLFRWAADSTVGTTPETLLWLKVNPNGGTCPTCCYGAGPEHADKGYDNMKEHDPNCLFVQVVKFLDQVLKSGEKNG